MTKAFVAALLLSLGIPIFAHRLDEYLQATIISLEKDRLQASLRLAPGVAVSSAIISSIDTNGDGVLSIAEQQSYAARVLQDLSLRIDGQILQPRMLSVHCPSISEIKEGLGEIQIEFAAPLPPGGTQRKLIFENHHQSRISAYLVNSLVPSDKDIRITAQNRNENQSFYQLDYAQAGPALNTPASALFWYRSVAGMFRLGVHHIAEGTDHLLFLLTLLLPAPLFALGSRWAGSSGVRASLFQILKVVTAFTLGHSLTLALAALGFVHVPSRPVEVLIAVSIFVSALHALRPLFPRREATLAAFFGLIHGLAFASTLSNLGVSHWDRLAAILGFNLGIESMQLVVVATVMPSLVLLSRTRAYPTVRVIGALFAGFASLGWIAERLFSLHNDVDIIVDSIVRHAAWIATALFVSSLLIVFSKSQHDFKLSEKTSNG